MRIAPALLVALLVASGGQEAFAGTGPFGVGLPEAGGAAGTGPFGRVTAWILAEQSAFYRSLTGALKALKADGGALVTLMGLSFAYGVFHAAGPGHGKVVLSSYLLANEATARRGAVLAFAASAVQATVAVLLVAGLALLLGATSMAITQATRVLEIGSYALIALLGASLLWAKLGLPRLGAGRPARSLGAAAVHEGHGADCACGAAHMPHPRAAAGDLGAALSAVFAIGARPCTGAIVVLVFALAQGLFAAGIASAYVMALGTAITVSALAFVAVYGKRFAVKLLGATAGGRWPMRLHRGLEIAGAALVLAFGLTLLAGALA